VSCRRCKYDFIMGRQLDGDPAAQERKRRLAGLGAVVAGILIVGGIVMSFVMKPPEEDAGPVDNHPCAVALRGIQPVIAAAAARGNPIPECEAPPPGPTACWQEVDVPTAAVSTEGIELTLERTRDGFDIRCRADMDGDGDRALYSANEAVTGVRISPLGVQ